MVRMHTGMLFDRIWRISDRASRRKTVIVNGWKFHSLKIGKNTTKKVITTFKKMV